MLARRKPDRRRLLSTTAFALLAALCSGDWLNARDETGQTFAIPVPR